MGASNKPPGGKAPDQHHRGFHNPATPCKGGIRGDIFIGNTLYLNQPAEKFSLNLPELTRHMGIFGSTGTGKTTLAKNILRELTRQKIPFIVFDWEKNYRDLIKENKEVKIFTVGTDISPFYFNYLKMPGGISYKEYVKNVVEVFNKPMSEELGQTAYCSRSSTGLPEKDLPTTKDAKSILEER